MNYSTIETFDPAILASDLCEVQRIYAAFFAGLSPADWDRTSKRGAQEWNVHKAVAHLCALNGDGLESVRCTLRGEPYTFDGLTDRYQFHAYNVHGIDRHLSLPIQVLTNELLGILDEVAQIARQLTPEQANLTAKMPIYNRPVKIIEALSIIMFHTGLHHSAQVTDPVGVSPLWIQLSPEIRHRVIGRVMCALSLLYRYALGNDLKATFAFQIDGPGGGNWHVDVVPGATSADEGQSDNPSLLLHLRKTDVFCRMFTGRIQLPFALLTGNIKLSGDLRLFPRFGQLFGSLGFSVVLGKNCYPIFP